MAEQFHTRALVLLNEEAVTKNGTTTGGWVTVPRGQAFNIWWYMTSAGAASVTINFDYSIFGMESLTTTTRVPPTTAYGLFHPQYASRTNYRTIQLGTGLTTKAAWTHIDTPDEMKYPFASCRVRVTEADVAAVTTITVAMAVQGL